MTTATDSLGGPPGNVLDLQRLRSRLLGLLALETLLIGAIGAVAFWHVQHDIRDGHQQILTVIVEEKRQQIESWLGQARTDSTTYFSAHALLSGLLAQWLAGGRQDPALIARLKSRFEEIAQVRGWGGLVLLDRTGRPLLTFGEGNLADDGLISDVLAQPRLQFVDLHHDARGKAEFGFLVPVYASDRSILGLAYLSWDPATTIIPLVSTWPVPTRSAETYLVRREDDQVRFLTPLRYHPDARSLFTKPLASADMPAVRAVRGERGILGHGRDYRDVPVLAYVAAIAETPWLIIAEIDMAEVDADLRGTAWMTGCLAVLVLVFFYAVSVTGWRRDVIALRQRQISEARLRVIFKEAPIGIAVIDVREDRLLDLNPRFAELLGLPREQLLASAFSAFDALADMRAAQTIGAESTDHAIPSVHLNKKLLRSDGTRVWIEIISMPLEVESDHQPRLLCMIEDITDRMREEERRFAERERQVRRTSEQRLTAFTELGLVGVVEADQEARLLRVNDRFCEITGYAREELIGRRWLELTAPEDQVLDSGMAKLVIEQGQPMVYEKRYRRKSGESVWVSVAAVMIRDQSDKPVNTLALILDISQRKAVEARLEEQEERLRLAIDAADLGVWQWDLTTGTVFCSDRCRTHMGLPPDAEPAYDAFLDALHHADRVLVDAALRHSLETHADYAMEYRVICPDDGSTRWTSALGRLYLAGNGVHDRMVGITRDITPSKQAAQNLHESERRFRALFEHLPIAYQGLDSEGRWVDANQAMADLLGFTAVEEMIGCHFVDYWDERRERPVDAFNGELRLHRRDGGRVTVVVATRVQRDDGGQFLRSHGVLTDITARRQMEEAIRQLNADLERRVEERTAEARAANAAKSDFLAHMSHEVRTPLNVMLGLAQVLEREGLTPSQQATVTQIRTAGRSLLAIINDILDLSKIEAGQLRIAVRPFGLRSLFDKLETLLSHTAEDKGVRLSVLFVGAPTPRVMGDPDRLEEVLLNLMSNALKFTERGTVAVRAWLQDGTEPGARLRVEVEDTGIGIAPEAMEHLFTPFTQADEETRRRYGGTGLGLAISKRLVELMGGVIGAVSEPGRGSTFWFELPLAWASADSADQPPAGPTPRRGQLRGAHFLVADDSAMNRELVVRMLALEGASATVATDGCQALDILRAHLGAFDAVLMDIRMPVLDGLTATRRIRAELGASDLPIIGLTAGVLPEQQAAALDAGMNDVLLKPLEFDQVATVLQRWVGSRPERPANSTAVFAPASARPDAATAADDWPSIDGIDPERAARVFGHNRTLFIRLLNDLVRDSADLLELTQHDVSHGDRESAARRMHSLRGNAANLGALDIAALARALEQAIDQGVDDTALDAPLTALGAQLAALRDASSPWFEADSRSPTEPSLSSARDVDHLRIALSRHDLGALRQFDELERALVATMGPAATSRLELAIRNLHYEEAITLLDRIERGDEHVMESGSETPT